MGNTNITTNVTETTNSTKTTNFNATNRRYTTIVFDCDGTLLNTLDDLADTMNYVLKANNYPTRTLDEIRRFVGNGLGKLVERAVPAGTSAETQADLLAQFKEYYAEHWQDKTAPYEGIYQLLDTLKEEGYKIAVVSNKIQEGVIALNEQYFKGYFEVGIGERPGLARKPEPDMVNKALEELGSTTEEAVYIGDSEVDLATAQNSKLLPIAVTWGFREEALLREKGAVNIAHKPDDVLGILNELNK